MTSLSSTSRSGRFRQPASGDVIEFTESVSFDYRLWRQDIIGSMAHAKMLRRIGVLNEEELKGVLAGLEQIGREIEQGEFQWDRNLEDVHMNIEAALTAREPAGAKLHTARSRNDQVALDLRMWLRDQIVELLGDVEGLQRALLGWGQRSRSVVIPGYTHLQRAQPVPLAHHLLAYVEMLERDKARYIDGFDRINVCPLGSGALAGSTLQVDRELVARELNFLDSEGQPKISQNSMDAVSDRDFIVEFLAASALAAVHLSRLSEDFVLWSSAEFGFVTTADDYTTGSSLMPQKKNPDLAELTRGKSGRVIGNLMAALTMLKGLPMTYNRDLQEDKQPLFDTADTMRACLQITGAMIDHTEAKAECCNRAAGDAALLATDLVDYLVERGVAFRHAHGIVGSVVALAERLERPMEALSLDELRSVDRRFDAEALKVFSLDRSLRERRGSGASGWEEVERRLDYWHNLLEDESKNGSPA